MNLKKIKLTKYYRDNVDIEELGGFLSINYGLKLKDTLYYSMPRNEEIYNEDFCNELKIILEEIEKVINNNTDNYTFMYNGHEVKLTPLEILAAIDKDESYFKGVLRTKIYNAIEYIINKEKLKK